MDAKDLQAVISVIAESAEAWLKGNGLDGIVENINKENAMLGAVLPLVMPKLRVWVAGVDKMRIKVLLYKLMYNNDFICRVNQEVERIGTCTGTDNKVAGGGEDGER